MLLIKTETGPGKDFFRLKRAIQLGYLLKKKIDLIFSVSGGKIPEELLKAGKFPFPLVKTSDEIFSHNLSSVLFDKCRTDKEDISLIEFAKKNDIKIIKFAESGEDQAGIDLFIDPTAIEGLSASPGKNNLSGPEYTILHHKYIHFNKLKRKYGKQVKNILFVPGEDQDYRYTRNITDILTRHNFNVKIVPGKNLKKSNLKTLRRIYPRVRFTGKIESLARPFFETDLAIVQPDISACKAAAAGTPAIYLTTNKNMENKADAFENNGAGEKYPEKNIDEKVLVNLIRSFTLERRQAMGGSGKRLIDGRGIYRIVDLLTAEKLI
ncbi:MAG: hypothetical protein ABFR75_05255 [Acidobacteriota bacterium]